MGIVTLTIICLTTGTVLSVAEDRQPVTDLDRDIPEFLFNCQTKAEPWIIPCEDFRRYLMIFDKKGNYLREKINKIDNSTYLSSSFNKEARKPMGKQIIERKGYPNYLFQLQKADPNSESFFIATKSGKLLVAGSEVNPSLHLREDHCALRTGRLLIVDSNVSSTVPSVSSDSTENPVTIASTTSASTESSVTATAISTPAPNLDFGCDQAHWKLWKIDERFLLIESVSKPGLFLNVESGSHQVRLGVEEKMTGLKTSFLSNITLDRSAGQGGEPGIGDDAYGDVVIHYFARNGSLQSGYVCDYEWGEESSSAVCKYLGFETGIPTYDGRYSITNTPEYAVSGLKCGNQNLGQCSFQTKCGSTRSCLGQNSMKAFGGTGYACNLGSTTDVAGVLCGNQSQINDVIKESSTCNRASLENDEKSVASMYKIQKQMKTTSSTMFENKHWSEYLLPMPMAVSLMSALLLVSSQNDREIELIKPSSGTWEYLKYDYLQSNLLFLSHNVKENFLLSNANMGVIKVNSRTIHRNMKQALQNAFSSSTYNYETLLPRNLKHIAEDASKNKEKADEVHRAFKHTNQIIDELTQGLKNTQGFQQNKREDAKKALEILEEEHERNKIKYAENLKLKKEYDSKVNESRKAFFNAATEAMNAQCVNEVQECNNCMWMEAKITQKCKPDKSREVCVKWDNPTCLEFMTVCTGGYSRRRVKRGFLGYVDNVAGAIFGGGGGQAPIAPRPAVCNREEQLCKKTDGNAKCIKHDIFCFEYQYFPEMSTNYCQDNSIGSGGKFMKPCTRCKWIDQISKNLENVADLTLKMQHSVLNDESSYSGVAGVLEDLVTQVTTIDQDVQNYNKWKDAPQVVLPIDIAIQAVNNESQPISEINQHVNKTTIDVHEKLKLEATRNISSTLVLTERLVNMHIDLLSQMKIAIARKSRTFALEVKGLLELLIARKVGKVEEMTEEEKKSVATLVTKGKEILKEANKLIKKYEIPIKAEPSSGGAADFKTGELAQKHLEFLSERHKTKKVLESLTNRMSNGIRDMFKQDLETQDINSIITKLVECSRYLNFLSEQWVELRTFFKKLTDFLEIMETRIARMTETYSDLGEPNLPRNKLTQTFKDNLQREIVDALSNNIYVGRIANYYTKIAEDGLLQRMASIGNYLGKVNDPVEFERLKKYIEDESIMTQNKIKAEVSKQEAKINDAIMRDVSSMKNTLACKLKDAENLSDETVKALNAIEEGLNKEKGVKETILKASPAEIKKINLFKHVQVDLKTAVDKIKPVEVVQQVAVDVSFDEDDEDAFD